MRKFLISTAGLVVAYLSGCGSDQPASSSVSEGGTSSSPETSGGAASESGGGTSSELGGESGTPNPSTSVNPGINLPQSPYVGSLMINELCPSNKTGALDESGSYPDWLELYNATAADISLSGFYLTDTLDNLTLGKLSSTVSIKANSVLLLWADKDTADGPLHLPFNLALQGESVYLLDPDQKLIDSVRFGAGTPDATYSRLPDGTGAFAWCSWGTPNRLNGATCSN